MNLHHIGIACQNIQDFRARLGQLFPVSQEGPIIYDPAQDATLCMIELEGGIRLELIEGKPVQNALNKNITYYHLCFAVPDIEAALHAMLKQGCVVVSPPQTAVLFHGSKVAFLYTPMGLVELLEGQE